MLVSWCLSRFLVLSFLSLALLSKGTAATETCSSRPDTATGNCMESSGDHWREASSVYDFTVRDIKDQDVSLSKYRGHVILIVNLASQCGFTDSNYKQLVELHEKYSSNKPPLSILGFPCNQFGAQEPATNEDIEKFAKSHYNVKFDLFAKININGDEAHPLWKYLKSKQAGTFTDEIKWNFTKFLINREGIPVGRYATTTEPKSIEKDIQALLGGASRL
ncbi:uncharacterized protein LOC135378612 [Ornithodoros turicata]